MARRIAIVTIMPLRIDELDINEKYITDDNTINTICAAMAPITTDKDIMNNLLKNACFSFENAIFFLVLSFKKSK